MIDKPTRISGNTSTLLDPIILSDTLNCNYSDVLKIPRHISDHDATIAFIKCAKATSKSFTRDIWLYDQTDFVRFNQMLTDINWNEKLCNFDDVDDMCEEFSNIFLQISSACIPSGKIILIREKDKPWFSNEIRKEIRIRDRLRKKLLKSQNENNIIKYKKQRNKVNNMKKIAKEKFENNLDNFLLNNSSNPKMYWKIMKMLIKSNKGNYSIPPLRNSINNQNIDDIAYDDSDKCELLNG